MWSLAMAKKRKKRPKLKTYHFGGYPAMPITDHCTLHLTWAFYERFARLNEEKPKKKTMQIK